LRHNCNCLKGCRHPKTGERVIDSTQVPLDTVAKSAAIVEETNTLHLVWADGHETTYDEAFLQSNMYAKNRHVITPIPNDNSNVEIDYKQLLAKYPSAASADQLSEEGQLAFRNICNEKLVKYGAIVVRNRGLDAESIMYVTIYLKKFFSVACDS